MRGLAAVIWIFVGTTIAGAGLVAVLSVEGLAPMAKLLIPSVAIAGYVIAIPVAIGIARKLTSAVQA